MHCMSAFQPMHCRILTTEKRNPKEGTQLENQELLQPHAFQPSFPKFRDPQEILRTSDIQRRVGVFVEGWILFHGNASTHAHPPSVSASSHCSCACSSWFEQTDYIHLCSMTLLCFATLRASAPALAVYGCALLNIDCTIPHASPIWPGLQLRSFFSVECHPVHHR